MGAARRSIGNSFVVTTMEDPVNVIAQYAPNNNPTSSQIHDVWQDGDLYMRTKTTEEGATWSDWHRIIGESGDETLYSFNISKKKTSTNKYTAPTDCYYQTWQDGPVTVNQTYPYLWMCVVKKTWNDATQQYDTSSPEYARLTGDGGEDYTIESTVGSVVIESNQTTGTLSTTLSFYKKEGSQGREAYSCFCTIFRKKGSTYTAIKLYTTAGAAITYTHTTGTGVPELTADNYDAIVVCIYNAASTSHSGYLAELEIPVRKNGDDNRKLDLDNEHEDFLYDDAGNRKSAIATSQARLYNGSSQVTTGITWAVSCDDGSNWVSQGDTYTSGNAKAKISSDGLLTVEEIYITTAKIKVRATYDYKSYYAEFTANKQTQDKYELVLSPNSIPYNPSSYSVVTIGVSAKRTSINGGAPTEIGWGAYTDKSKISTTSNKGYLRLFVAIKTQVAQSVYDYIPTQITSDFQVSATYASERENVYFKLVRYDDTNTDDATGDSGTLVDWENVPICKSLNGTNAVRIDLSNEADMIACDANGKVLYARDVVMKARLYNGATPVTSDVTRGSVNDMKIENIAPVPTPPTGCDANGWFTFTWTLPAGTQMNAASYSVPVTITYNGETYSATFTLARTDAPAIYQLLPSTSEIAFTVDANNDYTPDEIGIYCGYNKYTGSGVDTVESTTSTIELTYRIWYRYIDEDGNPHTTGVTNREGWMVLGCNKENPLLVASSTNYIAVEFALMKYTDAALTNKPLSSDAIDIESIPVIKGGKRGANGSSAVMYRVETDIDNVVIPSDVDTITLSSVPKAYFKKITGNTEASQSMYWGYCWRTGSSYTKMQTSQPADEINLPQTYSMAYDALVIFVRMTGSVSTTNFDAKKEIVIQKRGNTGNPGSPGSPGSPGKDAMYIHVKGTGMNNNQSALCEVYNGTSLDSITVTSRGLTIYKINRSTLAITLVGNYDVYGDSVASGETACQHFAQDLDAITSDYFVCIVSYDAVRWTSEMIETLTEFGSLGVNDTTAYRVPFAFIGQKGLSQGQAMQVQSGVGTTDPPAEIVVYVSNGVMATSKEPTAGKLGGRFYYNAGEYVNSSSISFYVNANEAPYFLYNGDYWVFEPNETSETNVYYTTQQMDYPSSTNSNWHLMFYNKQRFFMSDVMFAKYAHLGSFMFNGDWQLSTNGRVNNIDYNNGASIGGDIKFGVTGEQFSVKAYTLFNPKYPTGDDEIVSQTSSTAVIGNQQTEKTIATFTLRAGVVYHIIYGGKRYSDSYDVYIRLKKDSSHIWSLGYFPSTSNTNGQTAAFMVKETGSYTLQLYQPTTPSSSSTTAGGECSMWQVGKLNFEPTFAVDGLTGSIIQHDGLFTGFIKKRKVTITTSNITKYVKETPFGNQLLFDRCGTWIEVGSGVDVDLSLPLMCHYITTNYANRITEASKDDIRSYIGSKIIIYNKSGSIINVVTAQTETSTHATSIGNGYCSSFECVLDKEVVNGTTYEVVKWVETSGGSIL